MNQQELVKAEAQTPIACDLNAIAAEEREGHVGLAQTLFTQRAQEVRELADGYGFRFAAGDFAQVAAFVANERRCCPFLTFTLEVEPNQGPVWLRLTGKEPIKAFIQAEFGVE